jgi:hypothetical protein
MASLTSLAISGAADPNSVVLPVGTTAQRPGSPSAGMLRFNTSFNAVETYTGTAWVTNGAGNGLSADQPALSGLALARSFPTYASGYYWIKSPSMPQPVQMYVDMVEEGGGYDFYPITSGIAHSYWYAPHSGTPLGLDMVYPRSKYHWRAMRNFVTNVVGSSDYTYFQYVTGIYGLAAGNYTAQNMRDPYFYGSGAPVWRVKDGGRWWLRDTPYTEPNGDYAPNGFLGDMQRGSFSSGTYTLIDILMNDGGTYTSGANYLVSTNAKP